MTPNTPPKRHRGAQEDNKNALGNRGGRAPKGNQNARKQLPSAAEELIRDYPTQVDWITANKARIDAAGLPLLCYRDRALYSAFVGLTPERLVEKRQEYRCGAFVPPPEIADATEQAQCYW